MNATRSPATDGQSIPNDGHHDFHTRNVDGVELAGVLFDPTSGRFYEFVDPDGHDANAVFRCPRTGEEIRHDTRLNRLMGQVMSGHVAARIPADRWAEFREQYLEADDDRIDRIERQFRQLVAQTFNGPTVQQGGS